MLLAIDTATRLLSISLASQHKIIAEHSWYSANQHTVELSPAINNLLKQSSISTQQLTAIGVTQGYGSFTGVRIGMGVGKGLALGLSIPLVAIRTLDVVAVSTPFFKGHLAATIPAGRGRIIVGFYQWDSIGWSTTNKAELTTWENLISSIDSPTIINGEIDEQVLSQLISKSEFIHLAPLAGRMRRASYLAQLAYEKLVDGYDQHPNTIAPIYLKSAGQ